MRRLVRYIVGRTYKPLLVKYLSGTTYYTYKNIRLEIPPEVFHPRFFSSTKLLLKYISTLQLSKTNFLELGAGSGLISIYASRKGASVTASDINSIAINALKKNKFLNGVAMNIIESDLFDRIPKQIFDNIAINPPYYKKDPLSEKDYAWYCGQNGQYFSNLFAQLPAYINNNTKIIMVLCDGCDLDMIKSFAAEQEFEMNCIHTSQTLIEKNFIFSITKQNG